MCESGLWEIGLGRKILHLCERCRNPSPGPQLKTNSIERKWYEDLECPYCAFVDRRGRECRYGGYEKWRSPNRNRGEVRRESADDQDRIWRGCVAVARDKGNFDGREDLCRYGGQENVGWHSEDGG